MLRGSVFFCIQACKGARQDDLLQESEWESTRLGSDNQGSLPDLLTSSSFVGTFTTPSR